MNSTTCSRQRLGLPRAKALVVFIFMITSVLFLASAQGAYAAPTAAEKQLEVDAARERLATAEAEMTQINKDFRAAVEAHDEAKQAVKKTQMQINSAQARIKEAQALIDEAKERLAKSSDQVSQEGQLSFMEVLVGASGWWEHDTPQSLNALIDANTVIVQENENALAEAEAAHEQSTQLEETTSANELEERELKTTTENSVAEQKTALEALDAEVAALTKQEELGQNIVAAAASRLGLPYVWGATGPDSFDCSGLTSWSYTQAGAGWIGRTDADQYANAKAQLPYSSGEAEPGDVLWWPGHVAIYAGNGQYIHAPVPGDVIKYDTWNIDSATILKFS